MSKDVDAGAIVRLVRRLAVRGAGLVRQSDGSFRLLKAGQHLSALPQAETEAVAAAVARGLIADDGGGSLCLSPTGAAFLRRSLAGGDPYAAQHQERVATRLGRTNHDHAIVNQAESPLAWLRSRKGRDGRPLIDAAAYVAGERLRTDFTRGRMMPRVTGNWTATVAHGRRHGGAGGAAELTEAALAARQRVERALDAAGPELAGLLVDFCCFLKGIEEIERERQWPARSAKVVLKLALNVLARHYGLAPKAKGLPRSMGVRHWGTDDYRPTVD